MYVCGIFLLLHLVHIPISHPDVEGPPSGNPTWARGSTTFLRRSQSDRRHRASICSVQLSACPA